MLQIFPVLEVYISKITGIDKEYRGGIYLSTDDKSFNKGKVGEQIRLTFKNKCKYEI